jgi:hypothetical protein
MHLKFLAICDDQGGDHSETNLANSGYNMPDMKVRKTKNQDPSIFLGYLLKLIVEIWQFEFSFSF